MADHPAYPEGVQVRVELWEHAGRIEARIIVCDADAEPLSPNALERIPDLSERPGSSA